MSASAAVLASALTKDWRGKWVGGFFAGRDLPNCIADLDASVLTGSVGSAVTALPASYGSFTLNIVPAVKPTIVTGASGLNALRFGTSAYLRCTDFGAGVPGQASTWAQPLTYACVFQCSTDINMGGNLLMMGSSAASLRVPLAGFGLYVNAGSDASLNGPAINDGAWHVAIATLGPGSNALWLDGYLITAANTQSHGTGGMGNIFLGPGLSNPLTAGSMDIAQAIVCQSILTSDNVDMTTQRLAAKWGIS